jgi:hypothetical protein
MAALIFSFERMASIIIEKLSLMEARARRRIIGSSDWVDPRCCNVDPINMQELLKIQMNFHQLMVTDKRSGRLIYEYEKQSGKAFRFPNLVDHVDLSWYRNRDGGSWWKDKYPDWKKQVLPLEYFPIPGMFGGFIFCVVTGNDQQGTVVGLQCKSFCRVWEGSTQLYYISPAGCWLLANKKDSPNREDFPYPQRRVF